MFTGKRNKGLCDFQRKTLNYGLQTKAPVLLMTDEYPKC